MADTVSILKGTTNSYQTTAEHFNAFATDILSDGIVGSFTNTSGVAPSTGGLAVNAQGSPNMTVAVTAGIAWVTATPTGQSSQRLRANIAAQNATISSNATGGTRFDHIYVSIDATNANTPNVSGSNVASIVVSRSTSSSTDNGTPPTYGFKIAVVTVANAASSITNGNIADVRTSTVATGSMIQMVGTNYSAVATGTTQLPVDDTVPQNTEGDQYMSQAITPQSATNVLIIDFDIMIASDNASRFLSAALFQDTTANALAAKTFFQVTANAPTSLAVRHKMTAGTTSSITFKVRAGAHSTGTTTMNGASSARYFGGVTISSIRITEVKA